MLFTSNESNEVNSRNDLNAKHDDEKVTKSNHLTWMIWVDKAIYKIYGGYLGLFNVVKPKEELES